MTSKVALKTTYPTLQKLFHEYLRIPNAGLDILVQELALLSYTMKGQAVTQMVKDRIWSNLVDIADALSESQMESPPEWLQILSSLVILPVEIPSSEIFLYGIKDDFYIPDKSGVLRDMFSCQVPVLSLSINASLFRIQPLLESAPFKPCLKFLEESVHHAALPEGESFLDSTSTEKYVSRTHYLER